MDSFGQDKWSNRSWRLARWHKSKRTGTEGGKCVSGERQTFECLALHLKGRLLRFNGTDVFEAARESFSHQLAFKNFMAQVALDLCGHFLSPLPPLHLFSRQNI